MEHYRRRCNELGVQPKQPGGRQQRPAAAGAAPAAASQPAAAAAAALFSDPAFVAAAANYLAGRQQQQADDDVISSLDDWQITGSCMVEECSVAAAAETRAARNSQPPLSFVPPPNVQPRMRTRTSNMTPAAPDAVETAAATCAADDLTMQLHLTVPYKKRSSFLKLLGLKLHDSEHPAGAALPGDCAGDRRWDTASSSSTITRSCDDSFTFAATSSSSSSSSSTLLKPPGLWGQGFISPGSADQEHTPTAAAAVFTAEDIKQQGIRLLAELACPGSSTDQLFASYEQNGHRASMHTFISHDPASCPMLRTNRGTFMPDKPVADSGCIPSIMSEGQAKKLGFHIYRFKADDTPKVVNIEGSPAERYIGRTEQVSVVFGCGTATEVRLDEGFLVVDLPAVERMYSCVLGRNCLDKVSGFVFPFMQSFFDMPQLQEKGTILASMPVKSGSSAAAASAASAYEMSIFACSAVAGDAYVSSSTGQGTDEENTTGQGSGTSSSRTELHFYKPSPHDDPYCRVPPPRLEIWEPVGSTIELRQVNAAERTDAASIIGFSNNSSSSSCDDCCETNMAEQQQQPAKPPDITHAHSNTKQQPASMQQQHNGLPPIYAACRWTVLSLTWLLTLLPVMLLNCMGSTARACAAKLMTGLCDLLLQKPPYNEDGTVYYRLGRTHRSQSHANDNAGRKLCSTLQNES
jgi:hypothetical protein